MKCERQLEITVRYEIFIVSRFWQTESNRLNAMKTMSMRIRGAKTELEEAGESTDGMAESTASLRAEIKALSGVDIMLNENTFKSTYQIMDELSEKWEDLSDIAQATIIELVAGKHQGNVFSSLMANFDTAREALDTSLSSSGSAMQEHAKWSESLEARLNKLKAAWQSLSQSFLKSDFLKGALNAVIGLTDGLGVLIDTFGALPTIATAFAAFKSFTGKGFFKVIEDEAALTGHKMTSIFGQVAATIKQTFSTSFSFDTSFEAALVNDVAALQNYIAKLQAGVPAEEAFAQTMREASAEAQHFAQTMNTATMSASQFETIARQSQITEQAASFKNAKALIAEYNGDLQNCKLTQTEFIDAVGKSNTGFAKYLSGLNGAKGSLGGYIVSLIGAKAATFALEAATLAMNAALTMGISLIVTGIVNAVTKWINSEKELAEKVDEVTSKFEEQHKSLQKLKGSYDTTNESSMISRYEKLSRGVNRLGENVSLTADEYSEYQSIVNTIADQIPSLVSGYDDQGNALLSVKGNVEELTKAYENLIKAENNKILSQENVDKIDEDFENAVKKANSRKDGNSIEDIKYIEKLLNGGNIEDQISKIISNSDYNTIDLVTASLDRMGFEKESGELNADFIQRIFTKNRNAIVRAVEDFYFGLESEIDGKKSIAQAALSNALDISDSTYYKMSDTMKNVARQVVNSFDYEFFAGLQEKGIGVEEYINDLLSKLSKADETVEKTVDTAFNLQTQFNNGEVSYGEYVDGLYDAGLVIDKLVKDGKLDKEVATNIKLSFGLNEDGIVEEYQTLVNRLASSEDFDIDSHKAITDFVNGLSAEEVSVLLDIIPELSETEYKETLEDVKAALEREMIIQGLTFDLNLEVETAGIDALNTALAESVSGAGLSSESIAALKGRYSELEKQGYNLSSMFEETSNGIHLNRKELNKLEKAYASQKLDEINSDLAEMQSVYDDLGEQLKTCGDEAKAGIYSDRLTLAQKISEAATLAAQYEGLTSAYNDWLSAEEAGQERDMYENIISGFETIDDEISRGWIDDAAIEFLELLTGRTDLAGKSGKQLKEIYDGLDDTIKNTGYSIRDFFTVDEDGNSTNTGVYNFLDAIGQLEEEKFGGKDVVKRDKDGNIIAFDFGIVAKKDENGNIIKNGDEVIAEALGISEELVQIMIRASDDAGFVISMDGTYRQLADLQNEATSAAEYLHKIGKTDFEFDFNTTSVTSLNTQLKEAHEILKDEDFWNKDGTFNYDADGATQAMQIVSTLQAKLDNLTAEKYGIGLTVEDEEFEEPLENLQDYGRKVATLNQLELNPKANADEIEKINGELDDIAEYFANLDSDLKVQLGFESDDGIEEVKKKIESGEVKIPTVLDIQANMDKNIETLADLALLNSGLLSESEEETIRKKYKVEVEADQVDTSDVEEKIDNAVIDGLGNPILSRKANIEIIAETFGIEDVDGLSSKLEGLDDKTIQAIAEAVGQGDVEGLDIAIANLDGNTVQAVAEALGYSDVETLKAAVGSMQGNEVDAKVNTDGQAQKVWDLQSVIDGLKGTAVNITLGIKKAASSLWGYVTGNKGSTRNDSNGFSGADGTAHANGTTGRAFRQGSWGTKNSGTALVGELGRETLVRDGRYYTIGDNGAEFIRYQRGDIIFNHRQTEELFRNGKVTSGGGRAKAFANGTAFSRGTGGIGKFTEVAVDGSKGKTYTTTKTTTKKNKNSTTTTTTTTTGSGSTGSGGGTGSSGGTSVGNGNSGSGNGNKDKFEETFDWVEIAISRIERAIDKLDQKANNIYKSWSSRNKALVGEIDKVGNEIDLQQSAYERYIQEANSVGLSSSWASKVRNGKIDINTITDEALAEKIKEYQEWYEKALDCQDTIEELKETEASLYAQRVEHASAQYEGILGVIEHEKNMLDEYISQSEAQGWLVSEKYYEALAGNERDNLAKLEQEKAAMLAEFEAAMASGKIDKNSEAYYDMVSAIDEVTLAIAESETALLEYEQTIQQLSWERFDLLQEKISSIAEEANFLIELMNSDKLFDDKGRLTDEGRATMGLHGQNYNSYMYQADLVAEEAERLRKELEQDPYDTELEARYREMIALQQEYILSAQQEKEAIRDLVEEGISLELDALQELIDKKNEALESERSLYEYQKKVKEQTEEIAALEKQMAAYSGDDSEEAKQKIQQIKVDLETARQDLQETEYDKWVSDQQQMLDDLYLEYEEILNMRLDNIDALISDMIEQTNADASIIGDTIRETADSVGYTLSDSMQTIWGASTTDTTNVITTYGEKFTSAQTTTNNTLGIINTNLQNMITQLNKLAGTKVKSASTSSADNSKEANASQPKKEAVKEDKKEDSSTIKVGGKINAGNAKIYDYAGDKSGERQYYRKDPIYTVLAEKNGYLKVRWHKLSKGTTGWFKKGDVKALATGARKIDADDVAWTQEMGREFIVRPSDGAILTPVAKGDSVLNAAASNNIWDMANSPAEFIKDNLNLGATSVPNNSNVQSTYTQHLDKVVFNLPNVKNYEELLSAMQKDRNFEKLILSMTIDSIAGKSSLTKGKSIR